MYRNAQPQNSRGGMQQKQYYTAKEIAEILSISPKTVYKLVDSGAFEAIHIGTSVRVSKSSFEAWLSGLTSKE